MNSTIISQESISYVTGLGVLQWSIDEFIDMFCSLDITVFEIAQEKLQSKLY